MASLMYRLRALDSSSNDGAESLWATPSKRCSSNSSCREARERGGEAGREGVREGEGGGRGEGEGRERGGREREGREKER